MRQQEQQTHDIHHDEHDDGLTGTDTRDGRDRTEDPDTALVQATEHDDRDDGTTRDSGDAHPDDEAGHAVDDSVKYDPDRVDNDPRDPEAGGDLDDGRDSEADHDAVTDRDPDAAPDREPIADPYLGGDRDDDLDDDRRGDGDGDGDGDRAERPEFHDPAPVPSAFGAPTVGGAVAAAALASDERGKPDPRAEQTTGPGDGATDDSTRDLPDGAPVAVDQRLADQGPDREPAEWPGSTAVGVARPVTEEEGILAAGAAGTAPRTDEELTHEGHEGPDQDGAADRGPVGATADDGALLPGTVPVDPVAALVPADAAQGFRDRWREVQLRFVDDPHNAASDARELVNDVVESLTSALTAQRDALSDWQGSEGGEGSDTERLRVAVRRYRDLVDRLLSL